MTKVNPNHGNKTISDIFPWDILKSDVIFHFPFLENLVANLHNKTKYVIYIKNLKQALNNGLVF